MVTSQVALFLQGLSSHRVCTWGSRQQIRIIRGANKEAGYESSDYDDLDTRDRVFGWMYSILNPQKSIKIIVYFVTNHSCISSKYTNTNCIKLKLWLLLLLLLC